MPVPGFKVNIGFATAALKQAQDDLREIPNGLPRAMSGAINKTLPKLRTLLIGDVREQIDIKAGDVRDRMRIERASPSKLSGAVVIDRKAIPLIDFKARQGKKGVTVSVRKGQRELLRGTFIATMKSGHVGVFERKSRVPGSNVKPRRLIIRDEHGRRKQTSELPIQERFGPTPLAVIERTPGLLEKRVDATQEDLSVQLASQVDRLLSRRKPDAE